MADVQVANILVPVRDVWIEGDRQPEVLDLVVETDERLPPGAAEVVDLEHCNITLNPR